MSGFINYSKEEIKIFEYCKRYFEALPPIGSEDYENAFYDLVAQYGFGGEEYLDAGSLFSDLIEVQTEIAYEKLSLSDKAEIKELYENGIFNNDYYDADLEKYIYDKAELSLHISHRFRAWLYDYFDQKHLVGDDDEDDYYKEKKDKNENFDEHNDTYVVTFTRNISKQIINGFIESELEIFKTRVEEESVPGIQDDRSLTIAWLCCYFKDVITPDNASAIINFVDEVYLRDDYNLHCWYRISALQAAAFILTSRICYADSLVQNIGCGQGWARDFIVQSAMIICPLLSFDNQYLKRGVELNLKYGQFYAEESVVLYLITHGDIKEKRIWLEQQIEISDKERHIEFLSNLKKNRYFQSGFFIKAFSSAKSYFIFKLLSEPRFAKVEPELFDEVSLNYEELNSKEESHPLNRHYIDMSFLKEE